MFQLTSIGSNHNFKTEKKIVVIGTPSGKLGKFESQQKLNIMYQNIHSENSEIEKSFFDQGNSEGFS